MKSHASVVKVLGWTWLGSYLICALVNTVLFGFRARIDDLDLPVQIIVVLIVALYFYPLLWIIRYHAKCAKMDGLVVGITVAICVFSFWLFAAIIHFLRMCI